MMNRLHITKSVFAFLFAFALLHLVRDVMQDFSVLSPVTSFLKLEKNWCGSWCNALTYPFEMFIFIASAVVLRRGKVGLLGSTALCIFVLWAAMFLFDTFLYNR